MRKAFQMFDTTKCGFIETLKISTILNTMGQLFDDGELQNLIEETDPEGTRFQPDIILCTSWAAYIYWVNPYPASVENMVGSYQC